MARKHIKMMPVELNTFQGLVAAHARSERDLTVALTMLCAREGVVNASYVGVEEGNLIVEVPDPPKPELVK